MPRGPELELEPADYNRNREIDRMILRAVPRFLARYKRELSKRYGIDLDQELAGNPDRMMKMPDNLLPKMGQDLFRPPNVKGWDGGRTWINASTILARYNFLADLVAGGQKLNRNRNAMRLRKAYLPKSMRGKASSWDTRALLALPLLVTLESQESAGSTIDYLANLLLSRPLTDARRAKLLDVLLQARFDPKTKRTKTQILRVILLITSTPEYQLS